MTQQLIKNSFWGTVKEYGLITFGLLAYSMGWTIFLLPNNLIGGGVSGFASILYYATGLSMGVTYFILNVILLIVGTKILGTGFGGKTIYAIFMTSLLLSVMPKVIPSDFIHEFALSNGKLICTILGGIIAGFGIGLSISQGGSTGGTDIISRYINKIRPDTNFFVVTFTLNAFVAVVSVFVYSESALNYKPMALCIIYCFISTFVNRAASPPGHMNSSSGVCPSLSAVAESIIFIAMRSNFT